MCGHSFIHWMLFLHVHLRCRGYSCISLTKTKPMTDDSWEMRGIYAYREPEFCRLRLRRAVCHSHLAERWASQIPRDRHVEAPPQGVNGVPSGFHCWMRLFFSTLFTSSHHVLDGACLPAVSSFFCRVGKKSCVFSSLHVPPCDASSSLSIVTTESCRL